MVFRCCGVLWQKSAGAAAGAECDRDAPEGREYHIDRAGYAGGDNALARGRGCSRRRRRESLTKERPKFSLTYKTGRISHVTRQARSPPPANIFAGTAHDGRPCIVRISRTPGRSLLVLAVKPLLRISRQRPWLPSSGDQRELPAGACELEPCTPAPSPEPSQLRRHLRPGPRMGRP